MGQARRMLNDPRAKDKIRVFFEHWLEMDERDLAKDEKLYPEFTEETFADLRRSLHLFIDLVVWGEKSDYRELLLADFLMLNGRLSKLYGVGNPASAGFRESVRRSEAAVGSVDSPVSSFGVRVPQQHVADPPGCIFDPKHRGSWAEAASDGCGLQR